jgi:hypothetical protein
MTWVAPKGPDRRQAIRAEAARLARKRPEMQPGIDVLVQTADGDWLPKVTTTGIIAGGDFPVIWVRSDHEAVPWPAEDVRLAGEGRKP